MCAPRLRGADPAVSISSTAGVKAHHGHTYASHGTRTITLTETDSYGQSGTTHHNVTVH